MIVDTTAKPLGIWCWVPRFNHLPEDLTYLFLHRVAVLGRATPKPISHGVIEVADREGGHGAELGSSAVIAVNASDAHGSGLSAGLLGGCPGCPMGKPYHRGGAFKYLWRWWNGDDVFLVVLHRDFTVAWLMR